MAKTFSISVRLMRVTTENAHVSVPVSEDLLQPNADASGTRTIKKDKLIAAAIELGKLPSTKWNVEGDVVIAPHPLQTAPK